jgi:hypothetical protein
MNQGARHHAQATHPEMWHFHIRTPLLKCDHDKRSPLL